MNTIGEPSAYFVDGHGVIEREEYVSQAEAVERAQDLARETLGERYTVFALVPVYRVTYEREEESAE